MTARFISTFVAVMACLVSSEACSVEYSALPMSGVVVDAETDKPLAGVNVVAQWQLEGGWEGGTPLGAVMVMETLTDESGRYQFPGWGPKNVSKPWGLSAYGNAHVQSESPGLYFFKSGYEYVHRTNYSSETPKPRSMQSEWNEKTIALKSFHGSSKEYAKSLSGLSADLTRYTASASLGCSAGQSCPAICQWENIPNMVRAVGKQFKAFETDGIHGSNIYDHLLSNESFYTRLGCASTIAFLGRF